MRVKHFIVLVLILFFTLHFLSSLCPAFQKKKEEEKSDVIIIPDKVKSLFEEGMETREARLDIPFSFIWHTYLPSQQNLHCVFYFKVKNADLGFFPIKTEEEKPEKEKKEKLSPTEPLPTRFRASGHVFLQFNRFEDNRPKEVIREAYIPLKLEIEAESFQPDKEEFYSTGYPVPPGDYLLSMAIASSDLEKVGIQYFEFSVPDITAPEVLMTTPIFFISTINRIPSPPKTASVQKEFFIYSVLQITPKFENLFSMDDNLDIFFFIFGASPEEGGKFNIDVNFEITKGEEKIIRYQTAHYEAPIISQPLPLKKLVMTKSEEGEKREQRNLEAGTYTLHVDIEDKVGGSSLKKTVDFEVKETNL
ncbi:MAG: hypothetical protein GTO16_04490 [Candidatus Aminicenantes bacterium]|nr:hypothetical protein [Candidatus Aminicenantes bacterium]